MSTDIRFIKGDARHLPIEDESVQCIVTSPPYWGLRKYSGEQEVVWEVGPVGIVRCDFQHDHEWEDRSEYHNHGDSSAGPKQKSNGGALDRATVHDGTCIHCGAWRGAYGLEPTIEMYVQHTVEVLREMWRVLRKDGILFWNIGDSYHNGDKGGYRKGRLGLRSVIQRSNMAGDIPGARIAILRPV